MEKFLFLSLMRLMRIERAAPRLIGITFRGLAIQEDLVAGVTAGGEEHRRARKAAEGIRYMFKKKI
jgi:hypothetical protein